MTNDGGKKEGRKEGKKEGRKDNNIIDFPHGRERKKATQKMQKNADNK